MARDKLVQLRVSADELARYKGAAGEQGLSAWLRGLAERELGDGGPVEPEPLTVPASAKRAFDAERACLEGYDEAVAGAERRCRCGSRDGVGPDGRCADCVRDDAAGVMDP